MHTPPAPTLSRCQGVALGRGVGRGPCLGRVRCGARVGAGQVEPAPGRAVAARIGDAAPLLVKADVAQPTADATRGHRAAHAHAPARRRIERAASHGGPWRPRVYGSAHVGEGRPPRVSPRHAAKANAHRPLGTAPCAEGKLLRVDRRVGAKPAPRRRGRRATEEQRRRDGSAVPTTDATRNHPRVVPHCRARCI